MERLWFVLRLFCRKPCPPAGVTCGRGFHAQRATSGVHEPLCLLVSESRASLLLPSGSSSNSLRARQRIHTEQSRIWNEREVSEVSAAVDSTQVFGSEHSQSSPMELADRRCMARGIVRIDQGSAPTETPSFDCQSAAWHRR